MTTNFPFQQPTEQAVPEVRIEQASIVAAQTKAEIDIQISTAKAYPRDLPQVLKNIETLACNDPETAESCFYVLRRNGGAVIEGLSIRMAEIIESCWGNIRVQGRIIADDGKMITAQGICHDLETNNAQSVEVQRRVTGRDGRRYSDDMVVVTCNAAIAIAKRNAVLSVIPKALIKRVIEQVKRVSLGQAMDIETSRTNLLASFAKLGVTAEMVCHYLEIEDIVKIGKTEIEVMRGVFTAIKEGTTTAQSEFIDPFNQYKAEQENDKKKAKISEAIKATKEAQKKAEEERANTTKSE